MIRAERNRTGRFRLVDPLVAPADGPKVESLLAALVVTAGGRRSQGIRGR